MTLNPDFLECQWCILSDALHLRFKTKWDMIEFACTHDWNIPVPAILFEEDASWQN
jgi:hypothetical protein